MTQTVIDRSQMSSRGKMPLPHSCDLRKGRVSEPGRIYHVRTSTLDRQPLFLDFQLGRIVVHSLRFLHERGDVESLAFMVMPDHLHWLFQLGDRNPLDGVLHGMKTYTALQINRRRGIQGGTVWQPGYFDRALRAEEDVREVARYIVANPLRAGLCRQIGDYPLWDALWL
jgi:REP element-mobilizing transposase RayT